MSAPNSFIEPATAKITRQLQTQAADLVVLYCTATLGVAETVDVFVPTTTGGTQVFCDVNGTPVQISATVTSVALPGGILYTIAKNITLAATGVDVQMKPRIGPH